MKIEELDYAKYQEFNQKKKDNLYLITQKNCNVCKKVINQIDEIEIDEKKIYTLDDATKLKVAEHFGVIGVPCLLKINNFYEVDRLYGYKEKEKYLKFIYGE